MSLISTVAALANTVGGTDASVFPTWQQSYNQDRQTACSALRKQQCQQSEFENQREQATNLQTQTPENNAGRCSGNACGGTTGNTVQAPIQPGPTQAQQPVPASPNPMTIASPCFINKMVPDGPPADPIYNQGDACTVVNVATQNMTNGDNKAIKNAMFPNQVKVVPCTGVECWVRKALTTAFKEDMKHSLPQQVANAQVQQQEQARGAAEAAADGAEATEAAAIDEMMLGLINVANENAAIPGSSQQSKKILPQAIWMVQQMFHQVYVPMAVLLLLPGAIMTQMKAMVQYGFLSGVPEDEEMRGPSPFVGIFRSIIAVFLIPATQLIVSWMIDIGNSMTYEVEKYLVVADVFNWAKEQTYNPPTQNDENALTPQPDDETSTDPGTNPTGPDQGTGAQPGINGPGTNGTEAHSAVRDNSAGSQAMEAGFNMAAFSLAAAFGVLLAFQTVMMCYLLLLGPIAAAFYAWPSGIGSLFKKVFINWVDAVINLSLWRFWWVVVVLIMYVRIMTLKALGEYNPNSQWEMAMFAAFMVIICYVPFMPFEFKPGEMVAKVLEKAEQAGKGGGGGGGGGEDGAQSGNPHNSTPVTPPANPRPGNPSPAVTPPPPTPISGHPGEIPSPVSPPAYCMDAPPTANTNV